MPKSVSRLAMTMGLIVAGVLGIPARGAECLGVTIPGATKADGAGLVLNGLRLRSPAT